MTIRCRGCERYYPAGTSFSLEMLKAVSADGGVDAETATESSFTLGWDEWVDELEEPELESTAIIDLAVWLRNQMRQSKQWALADEIRDRLAELDIMLEDGPHETSWKRGE